MSRAAKHWVILVVLAVAVGGLAVGIALRRRRLCPEDTFIVAFEGLPNLQELLRPRDSATALAAALVFDRLLGVNPEGELVPVLADNFEARQESVIAFCSAAILPNGKQSSVGNIRDYVLSRVYKGKGSPFTSVRSIEPAVGEGNRLKFVMMPPVPAIRAMLRDALGEKVFPPDVTENSRAGQGAGPARGAVETNCPDRYFLRFHLRNGVKWHDGTPFTAEDVKFTAELVRNGQVFESLRPSFCLIKEMSVSDPYCLDIEYARAAGQAMWDWQIPVLPAHVLRGRNVADWPGKGGLPVGTGPFRWITDEEWEGCVTLAAVDNHFDPPPSGVRKVVFQAEPSRTARLGKLSGNLADAIEAGCADPSQWARLERQFGAKASVEKDAPYATKLPSVGRARAREICLLLNLRSALFHDSGLRKTICGSLDRGTVTSLMGLRGAVRGSAPGISQTERIKDSLLQLKMLGWHDTDGDGAAEREGKKLKFDCLVQADHVTAEVAARLISEDLGRLICKVFVSPLGEAALADRLRAGDFDLAIVELDFSHSTNLWRRWHSTAVAHGTNLAGLASPEVDAMLAELGAEYSPGIRQEIVARLRTALADESAVLFLGTVSDWVWRENLSEPKLEMIRHFRNRQH